MSAVFLIPPSHQHLSVQDFLSSEIIVTVERKRSLISANVFILNNDILMQSLSKIFKLVFIQRSKYAHGKQIKGTRTEYSEILNV